VVKFKAKRPITYAVRLVDWEENLGLGTELNGGDPYHIGDGGFIASFSDGTVTNNQWKAQTFYIAPLDNPNQVVELADGTHSSASATHSLTETAYALHYPLPAGWQGSSFSTATWPAATTYTEVQVGVNFPAYMNFQPQFTGSGAQFIWSSSLTLDNEVIVRYTGPASSTTQIAVEQPTGSALTDGSSTVAYGSVNVSSTLSKTFTLRNTSSTTPLSITGVTIDGTSASNFTITTAPATSIAASGSTTMVVQFNAASAGAKTAALHIASSDSSVGTAFDINLTGTGYIAPPVISSIRTSPNTPTYVDNVWVSAQIAVGSGTTLSAAQLSYGNGTQSTSTVLAETMSNTATTGTNGWDGTGAAVPWTLTRAGAGDIKQSTAANHGSGNICGLEMGKGTAVATGTMAQTTNAINAAGSAGSVEFWVATSNLTAGLGWTFQTSTDNTTWTTRLSETSGTNHVHQLYHYDLTAGERVSTLRIRFQFIGNGTGGPTGPKAYFDDITISVTTGSPPTVVTMYDDGLHGDGLAGDGVFGGAIPAQTAGTTITHSISATDANAGSTTSTSVSYTVSAVTPLSNWSAAATAVTGGNVTLTWPTQSGINYSVQWSDDLIHWNDIFLGATGSWTDTTAGGTTRRFYRISR
jgi:hypothetical protein